MSLDLFFAESKKTGGIAVHMARGGGPCESATWVKFCLDRAKLELNSNIQIITTDFKTSYIGSYLFLLIQLLKLSQLIPKAEAQIVNVLLIKNDKRIFKPQFDKPYPAIIKNYAGTDQCGESDIVCRWQ